VTYRGRHRAGASGDVYVPRHLAAPTPLGSGRRRLAATAGAVALVVGLLGAAVALRGLVLSSDAGTGTGTEEAAGSAVPKDPPEVRRPARPGGQGAPELTVPAPSPPRRVVIPAIGVSSDLEDLTLTGDGSLSPPEDYRRAGWFTAGTEPGQPGPAVIAGHVDSPYGRAVFTRLDELAVGDDVTVERADDSAVRFRVTAIERYPKTEFPTDEVYGPVPGPELRLVTCDGTFNRTTHHYLDNLVVYATLAATPTLG
jgi:LPXTG-site transpeptidase (sortase) family protein